jgi:hypothetical protein
MLLPPDKERGYSNDLDVAAGRPAVHRSWLAEENIALAKKGVKSPLLPRSERTILI